MNINDIKPSRQYSWVYTAETKLNKGGRAGVPENPLFGQVTARKVYCGQAASADMYTNAARNLNPSWTPSERAPMFEATENPCVVRSLSTGDLQVRILKPRTVKREYFVNGNPATTEQLEIIKKYLPKKSSNPLAVKIMFPYVDNLANVEGELAEDTTENDED